RARRVMQATELTREGARVLSVCNACRYCEQYCPAFQAMEDRLAFATADLNYLANLCHGCGECLYACQYAPPHEFAINVPQTFAKLRVQSYEQYAWPAALGAAFRHQGVMTALLLVGAMVALLLGATLALNGLALLEPGTSSDFYAVVPHGVMVAVFGGVGLFVLLALAIGAARCARELKSMGAPPHGGGTGAALRDALTLNHLHVAGRDCVSGPELRTPWRRWLHHATFYGFALCFASTCVATLYHFSGAPAPYAYTSLPVVLGTAGGIGLAIGTAGLLLHGRRRDAALSDATSRNLDRAFIVLLLATALTGLLLLVLRHERAMGLLLVVHLGVVLALFVTLPYGKLVHGVYRTIALRYYRRSHHEH
ncbi:MAG TPA: tricarballylate utilization 4Fe-4S protein TcuB, partial [Gammaproteobacteria bacterium]|nr:tricarballylate utilization 4Fe-4S protein TcuB [Gammaproteobacteria bacterium]